ncbi:MAG: LLM class F420-dependent oxidoreductase [Oscillochloris sp.]|nr:LLM class F420-dependent oxidoreductase [Oscillochloris sp.]
MKIGLQIPSFSWPGGVAEIGPRLANIGHTADDAGFSSLWVMDHFFQIQMVGPPEEPMLEGYTALSFLAGVTKRVTLGTLVTGVIYRYPGLLAKTVTTLDVLSGGRAWLGIGAAWNEQESKGLGVPFPPLKDRFEQLEEALQVVHQMWRDDESAYTGKHYQLERPLNRPQAIRKPHPPIMIGGTGEQKTLRMVAQYADACNLFSRMGEEVLRHKLDVLKDHCERLGRPYEEIEITTLSTAFIPGLQSANEIIAHCRSLAALGVQHAIFNMPNVHEPASLEIFAREVIPAAAEL